jgi:hypothetical protein
MDFSKIDAAFRKEIVREGTTFLDGQLKIATAADARATGLAAMFIAAASALTAGVVIAIFNSTTSTLAAKLPLMFGGGAAALCFIGAAIFCIIALRPVKFWLPGLAPVNWNEDVVLGKALEDCLGERAGHIQTQIDANATIIEGNAKLFRRGAVLGVSAPFVGAAVWALASICKFAS